MKKATKQKIVLGWIVLDLRGKPMVSRRLAYDQREWLNHVGYGHTVARCEFRVPPTKRRAAR